MILTGAGEKKIQVIKAVRAATGLGLKEAKAVVDGAPGPVKEGIEREEADKLKADLEEAGGDGRAEVAKRASRRRRPCGRRPSLAIFTRRARVCPLRMPGHIVARGFPTTPETSRGVARLGPFPRRCP